MVIIAALIVGGIFLAGLNKENDKKNKKDEFLNNQGITTGMLEETYYEM